MKASRSYWIAQSIGWLIFLVANIILTTTFTPWNIRFLFAYLNVVTVGLLLTHLIRWIYKKYAWERLSVRTLIGRIILVAIVIPAVWFGISVPINLLIYSGMEGYESVGFGVGIAIYSQFFVIILLWQSIYLGVSFFRNYKSAEIDKWKLEASLKDAELIALKAQINPHFLFNSLNNIRSLVIEHPEKARDMITKLSELLRYTVKSGSQELVQLNTELEITEHYLEIEKIHFEDRLHFDIQVDEDVVDRRIPPMSVQTLVENAIKHGISDLADGGDINLKIYQDEELVIRVENTGKLKKGSGGTGLNNALERLKLLCSPMASLKLYSKRVTG